MKNELKTDAIVINRINYGEYDRIITFITRDYGKVKLIAKSVRKQKSKMSSYLDYFCETKIVYFKSIKNEIGRLKNVSKPIFFENIITDIDRSNFGFKTMKIIDKAVETEESDGYFNIIHTVMEGLGDLTIDPYLVSNWFYCHFLDYYGYSPNLMTEKNGEKLDIKKRYIFSFDDFSFKKSDSEDSMGANEIKFLRLIFSLNNLKMLNNIPNSKDISRKIHPIVETMFSNFNLV